MSKLTVGTTTLTFTFSAGANQSLAITVSDSTPILSDDANLSDLRVDGQPVTDFVPEQMGPYSVSIPYNQASVAVDYTTSDATATVRVVGDTNLVVGENTVTVTVTAESGNTKDYTITVTRAAAPTTGGGNNNSGGGSTAPITPEPPVTSTDGQIIIPVGREGEVRLGEEVTLSIPTGAADQELTITIEKLQDIQHLEQEGFGFVSPVYELLKNRTENFKKPVTLTIKFDPTQVNEGQIPAIYYYDEVEQEWIEIGGKLTGDRITVDVDHFTKFAVLVVDEKPEITFSDITGHWAEEFILEAARLGIIKGHVDGTFKPDKHLTRAQAVSILVRALDLQTEEAASFKDITSYAAETQAEITAAYKYGLVIGQDGNFMPSKKVSRSQMALMLHRAYEQKTGVKYVASEKAPYPDIDNYDKETINAISTLYEMGIATGSNGKYMPANPTTRAHAAKMLVHFLAQE